MADWAAALAGGIGAAATTGANIIGDQMKQDQQIAAEQRAANTQLDLHMRMAAADEMMKNRALEDYSGIVKQQMGVQVPLEAPSVAKTGLTDESATKFTPSTGDPEASAKFHGDQAANLAHMQKLIDDPKVPDDVKKEAQNAIDAIKAQTEKQKEVNEDGVDGKTRPRTMEEAVSAANDYALQNNPTAYVAGTKAYNDANKDDIAEKKLAQQLTLQREAGARAERLAQLRADTLAAKLGGGGKEQANIAQVEYLMGQRGLSQDQALAYVYGDGQGLAKDPASLAVTLATQFLANGAVNITKDDPPGTTKASKAMQMAMDQVKVLGGLRRAPGMLDPFPGRPGAPAAGGQVDPMNPLGLSLPGKKGN